MSVHVHTHSFLNICIMTHCKYMWNKIHELKMEFKVWCYFSCITVFIETILAFNFISCLIFSIIHEK